MAKSSQKKLETEGVAVLGLGRFGSAVVESLTALGHEVLGIDSDGTKVQHWADHLTQVAQADCTDIEALRQLGVDQFKHVVVSVSRDLEASVLTVLALQELEIANIWARATSKRHGLILERTGAHRIVYPETSMGDRVAHLVTGRMIDFIKFDDGFAIASTAAPEHLHDKTLADADVHKRFGVNIVGLKRHKVKFIYAKPETVVHADDILIVGGQADQVETFAASTGEDR
ncbi:trk system potassium uptake protein TrkA [Halopseudomonas xinjiangensis]|uniref:Trk system potassium uptake protein TrkA n=1 Tax=Halopseudomonas xinjiangensis TaxID=487184 RepID=A0A1H1X058_9GAMM|nr:TrkA family potassium uptake protein [Halopseudomonas xinjiangensis]SDT02471.1 trk system potassium uptake protein TrkA [Halopseudomonas xinjiangensis]